MDVISNNIPKPALLSVDDAKNLGAQKVIELFSNHLNPGQLHFMKLLGFRQVIIDRAEGMHYIERGGRKSSTSSAASARWLSATTIRAF